MALTLLASQNRVRSWFLAAIGQGIGPTSIIGAIVEAGFGFRTQEMFRFYHQLEGFAAQLPIIEKMYADRPIPNVRHWASGPRQQRVAVYRSEISYWDNLNLEADTEGYTFAADEAQSWGDIEAGTEDIFYRYNNPDQFEITGMSLYDARLKT